VNRSTGRVSSYCNVRALKTWDWMYRGKARTMDSGYTISMDSSYTIGMVDIGLFMDMHHRPYTLSFLGDNSNSSFSWLRIPYSCDDFPLYASVVVSLVSIVTCIFIITSVV
jgi:hypothetical protein